MLKVEDLRLDGFLPGLLVPPSSAPSATAGFLLITAASFSFTIDGPKSFFFRLAIAPLALYCFWDYGFGPYMTPQVQVDVSLAVIGLWGMMRVIECTFVGLTDKRPPYWITDGKEVSMPVSVWGKLAYALDLTTSLRGNSWFLNTHFNWLPKSLLKSPTSMTRIQFLTRNLISLVGFYFIWDICDTLNKSRSWDLSNPYPITTLPWYEQLVFAFSVCLGTALSIWIPYTMISTTAVLFGSYLDSWPPIFDSPFSASSLSDFWTRRWHHIFRRVFDRLAHLILLILPIPSSAPSYIPKHARAIVIFMLSATLHILLMYRVDMYQSVYQRTFLDPSIIKFFLSQPIGLAIEALIIIPLANILTPQYTTVVTRIWAWMFLLYGGRFWSDVWVHRGFWEPKERVVGWSVVRGLLYGQWAV